MDISFKGKRAIVTGAGQGIGRCIAKTLVNLGAEVVVFEQNQVTLDSLKIEVPSIQAICIDITNIQAVMNVIQDLGDIHLLVNNAGVLINETFLEITPEAFDKTYNINTKALLFVTQAVARKMVSRGIPGSIVNISSDVPNRAYPELRVYGSSKAAVNHLTKVMALELGPHKIRVNAVQPTLTLTGVSESLGRPENKEKMKSVIQGIPLRKHAEIHEITNAVLFLLSEKASMIHGACLLVDGGRTIT